MKRLIALVLAMTLILSVCSLAAADDKVKIRVLFLQNTWHGDPNDMEIYKKIEEMSGVEVEWIIYSSATWNEKKQLVLAGQDLPDVFYMNALSTDDVNKFSQQGMLVDLTDLIPQYCPNLTAVFEKMPHFKAVCTNQDDGRIYNIARAAEREAQYMGGQLYINKAWLDKLGLAIPETMEEYHAALKAFKEQDPNGNGVNDEIPFTFYYNSNVPDEGYTYDSLFGAFGLVDGIEGVAPHFIKTEDGQIVYVPMQEQYKNAIKYFHQMIEENLWDVEGFTSLDSSSMNAKGHNDPEILGSFIAYDETFIVPESRYEDYVLLAPLAGEDGTRLWLRNGKSNGNVNGTQFQMTVAARGKEEAIMRWLDAHFDQDISIQLFLGAEGTTIQKNADGMYEYIPTPEGMSYSEFRYHNAPVHVPCAIPAADWGVTVQVMDEDKQRVDAIKNVYGEYMTQSNLFLLPNNEESAYFLAEGTDIKQYVNNQQVKWLMQGGIDEEWDAYLQKLENMGVQKYIDTVIAIDARMQ